MISKPQAVVARRSRARRTPAWCSGLPPGWRHCAAALAATGLLLTGITGCSHQQRLTGSCGVVVDGSQSGSASTGFNAAKQLHDQLGIFLQNAGCRYVVFGPIDGASQQSICSEQELDMDPDLPGTTVNRQALQADGRAAAMKRALAMLSCARNDKLSNSAASDVIGGLARIAQARPAGPGPYSVLVVSDFRNWASGLYLSRDNLATQASRAALINELASKDLVPDFHGASVYTAGFGVLSSRNGTRYPDFRAFWTQFMSRAHAQFYPGQS